MGLTPRQHGPTDPDLPMILDLIHTAFGSMEGRVDPPSSVRHLDLCAFKELAANAEVWSIAVPARACVVFTPKPSCLYVGKLATAASARHQGLARMLLDHAILRARHHNLRTLELECRVELTENHAAFAALGFHEVARTAHSGYDQPTSITFRRLLD